MSGFHLAKNPTDHLLYALTTVFKFSNIKQPDFILVAFCRIGIGKFK